MTNLIAFFLAANLSTSSGVVNPYESLDVRNLSSQEKEFVVDQEAKIKNSVPSIHDEIN